MLPGQVPLTPTVIVCAYTMARWLELTSAVREVSRQLSTYPGDTQLIVVIDHEEMLLQRARNEFAPLGATVVANTRSRGLSGARNSALNIASGDVIAFCDDDATPRPGWLDSLVAPYQDPLVQAVGGSAVPRWPDGMSRPFSLPAVRTSATAEVRGEFDWVVGCTYVGQPIARQPVRNLMGCNMSFRRAVFELVGGFSDSIGRVGSTPLGCEETELCIRLHRADPSALVLFEPAAVVDHTVTSNRMRWSYFWSRCWSEGLSKALISVEVTAGAALETERSYVRHVLPCALRRELKLALTGDSPRRSLSGLYAIVGGVLITGLGYLYGRASLLGQKMAAQVPTADVGSDLVEP